jgi:hypothetical protein
MDVTATNHETRNHASSFDDDRDVQLALLILEREEIQEQAHRADQQAARAERRVAVQKEQDALEDAADAMLTGAFVSAAFTVAGGGLQVAGGVVQIKGASADAASATSNVGTDAGKSAGETASASNKARADKWLMPAGSTLSQLAGPAGVIAGGSTQKRHEIAATHHREQASQAQDRAQDARDQASRAERNGDRVFELLRDIDKAKNNHIDALISRI